jgi:hypothetical protein
MISLKIRNTFASSSTAAVFYPLDTPGCTHMGLVTKKFEPEDRMAIARVREELSL